MLPTLRETSNPRRDTMSSTHHTEIELSEATTAISKATSPRNGRAMGLRTLTAQKTVRRNWHMMTVHAFILFMYCTLAPGSLPLIHHVSLLSEKINASIPSIEH
jgi:hypothetical protein